MRGHRVAVALVASVVLWLPTMQKLLNGTVDVSTAGLLWLVGLLLSMLGTQLVARLVSGYGDQDGDDERTDATDPGEQRPQGERRDPTQEPPSHPLRRRDDVVDEVVAQ